jgi:hypothetical protein
MWFWAESWSNRKVPPPCHHMSLMDFVIFPPGCGRSVTDFWGWDAHKAQLRCPDEVDGDIWSTRRSTLSNPIFLPPAYSQALVYFGLERDWWVTCNYPTVLKERNRKSTTCAICWLKSLLHEEKRREQENYNIGRCAASLHSCTSWYAVVFTALLHLVVCSSLLCTLAPHGVL